MTAGGGTFTGLAGIFYWDGGGLTTAGGGITAGLFSLMYTLTLDSVTTSLT